MKISLEYCLTKHLVLEVYTWEVVLGHLETELPNRTANFCKRKKSLTIAFSVPWVHRGGPSCRIRAGAGTSEKKVWRDRNGKLAEMSDLVSHKGPDVAKVEGTEKNINFLYRNLKSRAHFTLTAVGFPRTTVAGGLRRERGSESSETRVGLFNFLWFRVFFAPPGSWRTCRRR